MYVQAYKTRLVGCCSPADCVMLCSGEVSHMSSIAAGICHGKVVCVGERFAC